MSNSPRPNQVPQVNILLSFPLAADDVAKALTSDGGRDGRLDRERYAEARANAAELETRDDLPFDGPDQLELVGRVVAALAGHGTIGAEMAVAARLDSGDAGAVGYMTIDEIDPRIGPPEGMPIFNQYLGILSVPEPEKGGVGAVAEAVKGVGSGLKVEPAIRVYAIGVSEVHQLGTAHPRAVPSLGTATNGHEAGTAGARTYEDEDEEMWPEAALESGAAAETTPWGVNRVHAPHAWARGYTGQGVRVAVVDTGIAPHVDLPLPVAGRSFVPGVSSWTDDNGHGTHVAGTIGARRNGQGVIGVAPRCALMAVKVLSASGSGSDTAVANGITWAANNGANIINLSLGSTAYSEAIHRALVYARSRRVAICAAAGNDSSPTLCRPVSYPGRDPLCIGVAATTPTNAKAQFSCCGPELDLAAPGVDVLSTWPGNAYRVLNGTSMATPHVAGSAALVLQRRPGLDPSRLQRHLERSAVPLGSANQFGKGLIQCDRAVTIPILSTPAEAEAEFGAGGEQGGEDGLAAANNGGREQNGGRRGQHGRRRHA